MSRPSSFCVVLHNSAPLLGFSLLALRTEPDSRRTRGLKSSSLTGAFSANQRKPGNTDDLLIVGQAHATSIMVSRWRISLELPSA
jgi:hypothetical protein